MRLSTHDIASFVANGYLRFDAVVPDEVNHEFLEAWQAHQIPTVVAGTPLAGAFPSGSALHQFFSLPRIAGIITSLVGDNSIVDHHFVHVNGNRKVAEATGVDGPIPSQPWHQDSTIDTRRAFDIQIMWYPQEVTEEMGGTRFLPGSHLRIVSESAISRTQNFLGQQHVVCTAGTMFVFHHGIWHGGGCNRSYDTRTMYKVRLQATAPQVRLWDDSDLRSEDLAPRPIFFTPERRDPGDIRDVLCTGQPWYEEDTSRLELIQRIKMFRYMLGDESMDIDYWLGRLELMPDRRE